MVASRTGRCLRSMSPKKKGGAGGPGDGCGATVDGGGRVGKRCIIKCKVEELADVGGEEMKGEFLFKVVHECVGSRFGKGA